jgi:hypothetical protein
MAEVFRPTERQLKMKISAIAAMLALGMFISAPVYADDATPAAAPKADAAAKAAKAAECSKQADAQNLHGKKRKTFREECKKGK